MPSELVMPSHKAEPLSPDATWEHAGVASNQLGLNVWSEQIKKEKDEESLCPSPENWEQERRENSLIPYPLEV